VRSQSLPDGSIADMGKEAPPGFEPGNNGFADRRLTTWLRSQQVKSYQPNRERRNPGRNRSACYPGDLGNAPIRFNSSGDNACNIVLRRAIWAELRMLFRLEECQEFPFQVLGKSDPNDLPGP
jgi:hypothetical protein